MEFDDYLHQYHILVPYICSKKEKKNHSNFVMFVVQKLCILSALSEINLQWQNKSRDYPHDDVILYFDAFALLFDKIDY